MANTGMTPNMQSWTDDLNSVGRVEIKSSFTSLWWRVGLAIAIVAIFIYVRYNSGDFGNRGLAIAIIGFAVVIVGAMLFVRIKYGDKSLLVDRTGVTMLDGMSIPWTDVSSVSVWSDPRGQGPSSVQVNLSEQAWNDHMAKQHAGGKLMHKANKFIARDRAIIVPSYIAAKPGELAAWMNQFPQAVEPKEMEPAPLENA